MTERREDLSTADLAGQRPAEPVRVEHVEDADPDRDGVDRDGVDRDGVDGTDMDRSDADRTDLDRSDLDRGGAGRSDLDRDDTRGLGVSGGDARDGELRDTDRVDDVDTARSDDYDTDVTPAQSRGGSTIADPDALGDRTPAGTGPFHDSTGPGSGTTGTTGSDTGANAAGPLLGANDTESFRARWTDVQTGFVDQPRRAVEQADGLVAELMQHLATTFADERTRLESQWDSGDDVQTDDLRTAFQRYRSFFERLLAT
jgi:hypothetical protein